MQPSSIERARVKALHRYRLLDTSPDDTLDQLTGLAALICQAPMAAVALLDDRRQWFKARYGLADGEMPIADSFCQHTLQTGAFLEIDDTTQDARVCTNRLVTDAPGIRFYAAYPLTDPDGYTLGTLFVADTTPRRLTTLQRDALRGIRDTVVTQLVAHKRKQEELYLERMFALSMDMMCVAGVDGYFRKVNPAFTRTLGWDEATLLGTTFYDFVHPDDVPATEGEIARLATGIPTINFSHRIRCQDATYRTLQWVATPDPATGYLLAIGRDITDEKIREVQLHHSESRFRSLFESSQGFMCLHDLDGRLLMINQAGAGALGYTPDDLAGESLTSIVQPKHHRELALYLDQIRRVGQVSGLAHTVHRDGSRLYWLFNNVLEQGPDGQSFVIGNAIDITHRYRLEADLRQTKAMLEQTNEVARIGAWEVDLMRNTVYWSNVTRAIHEVAPDYVPTLEEAMAFYQGDNAEAIAAAVSGAIDHGTPFDLELQIVSATGRAVWVQAIGTPDLVDGTCKRLFGTFQDIDERKKAEQALLTEKMRLTAFVEHAPAAVAMLDRSLRYVAVSQRWLDDYRITRSLIGHHLYEITPDVSDEWRAIHERCLAGAVEKGDEFVWRPAGWDHDQYLRWEIRPWYGFDGSIGGIMIFTQDITQACQQRDELQRAKWMAEQASSAKSEFLANMSHEIRTPLNAVIGFTDLVLKTALTDTQQQYISLVNQSANTLLGIINDILDFSKIEAGKLELSPGKVDIYDISSQAADIITYQAQEKGLEMLLNMPPDLPRFVYTDAVRLKQVLVNLLGNAVKFTELGEVELKISAQPGSRPDHTQFRFEVRDTGIGIKPAMQQTIFDAFAQEDPSTTKKYGGTGLGLTISNKLLGLMGSRLELTSEPGAGSSFFFTLELPSEAGESPKRPDPEPTLHRVLVVDDNENNRFILHQLLAQKQLLVDEAANGLDALRLLKQQPYDLVLMDYQMPLINGLETIRRIRQHPQYAPDNLPIVLLHSSSDDEQIIRHCAALGVTHRLVKPIKATDLYRTLQQLRQPVLPVEVGVLPPASGARAASVRILIVEDNRINMLLSRSIVLRIFPNAQLIEAGNGLQAVAACRAQQPDLILMDIQMPEMNGYEATQQIRSLPSPRRVPILALTAGNVKGEREKCLEAGMDDFVTKPIVESDLRQVLSHWLPYSVA